MGNDNNNDAITKSKNPEPSTSDILNAIQGLASKDDVNLISNGIKAFCEKSESRFESIETKITVIEEIHNEQNEIIATLTANVEQLKQDKLRNNIRISGIIPEWNGDCKELVMKIITKLKVDATVNDFNAYATTNNKFVIISFYNYAHKASLLNKMRIKKSLLVEEIFPPVKSNSQLYFNDHLTPYYNELFITAFKAKKDGKLSSWGGRVRVRKSKDDPPVTIDSLEQLNDMINDEQLETTANDERASTSTQKQNHNRPGRPRKSAQSEKTAKRKANDRSVEKRPEKNARITDYTLRPSSLAGNNTNKT